MDAFEFDAREQQTSVASLWNGTLVCVANLMPSSCLADSAQAEHRQNELRRQGRAIELKDADAILGPTRCEVTSWSKRFRQCFVLNFAVKVFKANPRAGTDSAGTISRWFVANSAQFPDCTDRSRHRAPHYLKSCRFLSKPPVTTGKMSSE